MDQALDIRLPRVSQFWSVFVNEFQILKIWFFIILKNPTIKQSIQ